jgi:hypothetical protein
MPKGKYTDSDLASPAQAGKYTDDDLAADTSSPASQDFSAPKGNSEGTYRMAGPKGIVNVPYSKVLDASKSGLQMHPDDRRKYITDASADPNLKNLSPAPGVKVIGRNSAGQPMLAPEEQTPNYSLGTIMSTAGNVIGSTASGIYHAVKEGPQNPEEAKWDKHGALTTYRLFVAPALEQARRATEEFKQSNPSSFRPTQDQLGHRKKAVSHALATVIPGVGPWANQVGEQVGTQIGEKNYAGAAGTIAGNAAIYAAPKVASGAVNFVRKTPSFARSGIEAMTDTSPREVRVLAEETQKKNIEAAQKHLEKAEPAAWKTRGAEIAHDVSEREANEKSQKELDIKNEEERNKINEANIEQLKKEGKDRLETLKENRANTKNYDEEVKKAKTENETKLRLEKGRQKIESNYKNASSSLRDKYNAAFEKARKDYNTTWNKWRDMVKGTNANMKPVVDIIGAQEESMNPQQVGIFREILNETEPDPAPKSPLGTTAQTAAPQLSLGNVASAALKDVPAERLHAWKSQLEGAVRSTQDGTVRYAIGKVLQSVRDLETQVSSTVPGAVKQLSKARSITGPYFEAFFKSPDDMPRALAQSLREQTPGEMKTKAQDDRLDRIAAYDPSIKSLAAHVDNLETALKNIPKPPKEFTQLPTRPEQVPSPKPEPQKVFTPKQYEPIRLKKPLRDEVPDRPAEEKADIAQRKKEHALETSDTIRRLGFRRAFYTMASGIPATAVAVALGHPIPAALAELAAVPIVIGGSHLVAKLLEKPEVVNWLSKITSKDVAEWNKLPQAQKALFANDMEQVVKAARKKKIKVSPAMTAFVSGTASSQQKNTEETEPTQDQDNEQESTPPQGVSSLRHLREEAERRRPQQVASAESSSVKPAWTHIYDPISGEIKAI